MFNAPKSEWRVKSTPAARIHGAVVHQPNLTGVAASAAVNGRQIGGGVQTTVLANNDHHPLVIEFEHDHIRIPGSSGEHVDKPEKPEKARVKMLTRPAASTGRLLETHFDAVPAGSESAYSTRSASSTEAYTRSSSLSALYSTAGSIHAHQDKLNYSFPGGSSMDPPASQYSPVRDNTGGGGAEGPYISSSVMLPASSGLQQSRGSPNSPGLQQSHGGHHSPGRQQSHGGHNSPPKDEAGFYQNVTARFRQAASGVPPSGSIAGFRPSSQAMGGGGGGMNGAFSRNSRDEQNRNSYSRNSSDHLQHKSPKTQELEEFAAKFEGYQKQRSRRNLQQPTPMLDQLARESCSAGGGGAVNFSWLPANTGDHQLTALETNLLKLVQRNDSITRRSSGSTGCNHAISEDSSSGRESVTTVISTCSNETLKYTDRHSSCETLRFSDNGELGVGYGEHGGEQFDEELLNQQTNNNNHTNFNEAVTSEYCDQSSVGVQDRYGDYMNMSSSQHSWRSSLQDSGKRVLARSLSESTSNHGDRIMFGGGGDSTEYSPLPPTTTAARGTERSLLTSSSSHISEKLSAAMRNGTGRKYYSGSMNGGPAGHPDWSDYVPPEEAGIISSASSDIGLQAHHTGLDFNHVKESYAASVERSLRSVPNLMRGYESSSNLNYGRSGESLFGGSGVGLAEMGSPRGGGNGSHKRKEETLLRSASEVTMRSPDEPQMPLISEAAAAAMMRQNGGQQMGNYSPTAHVDDKILATKLSASAAGGRRKPKLPTPPSSPNISNVRPASTPSPPPPPPSLDNELIHCSEPLPPPPGVIGGSGRGNGNVTAAANKLNNSDFQSSHYSNSHQRHSSSGSNSGGSFSSRYSNKSFVPATVGGYTPLDSINQPVRRSVPLLESNGYNNGNSYSSNSGSISPEKQYYEDSNRSTPPSKLQTSVRQPASTPKRDSPATIAAKEAPGWQMFLGVRSSTVNFTSEEANKFRAARDSSKTRSLRRDSNKEQHQNNNASSKEDKLIHPDDRPKTRRDDIRDISRIKTDNLRRDDSTKLRRTESRGRKRPENPNRSPEMENINPNQKRPSVGVGGASQRHNQQLQPTNNPGSVFHHHHRTPGHPDKYLGKSIRYEDKTQGEEEMMTGGQSSKRSG